MTKRILDIIARQHKSRIANDTIGIKVNLYKGYEIEAVSRAVRTLIQNGYSCQVDCLMIADSFLMTHLGYSSTLLSTEEGQTLFLRVFCDLVFEARLALSASFEKEDQPYLIADMPHGSTVEPTYALKNAIRFVECGADVVKIEVASEESLETVETLSKNDVKVMAHIGYTPQSSKNRTYGADVEEALRLFELARQSRDAGACALVLERVSEFVNRKLCEPKPNALPIYSIFSGQARYGGQCLNVWDSVYKPNFRARMFPPTAEHDASEFPHGYDLQSIEQHFEELLEITLLKEYPPSSGNQESEWVDEIVSICPWTKERNES